MTRSYCKFGTEVLFIIFMGAFLLSAFPSSSEAIPAFARKYDLSCTSCHTKPPRLNEFGEAFHMAGYQIPATMEGETKKKRKIGRVNLETSFLNIFGARVTGDFVESFSGGDKSEINLTLPRVMELYFAGTFTDNISYFFNVEGETKEIEGTETGFEEKSFFGIGREFFLMIDLAPVIKKPFSKKKDTELPMSSRSMKGPMIMGPMLMIGKIDPSTNFSYSTNRQFILDVPGRVGDSGKIERFSLTPYAFASKFFGLKTGKGKSLEVTKQVLYNTTGDMGADLHGMVGNFLFQAGLMQGVRSGTTDVNRSKDPYFVARYNFGNKNYFSGSLSGLVYWGNDTASVDEELVDWLRYGLAGNIKYRHLDIYGALIWDEIKNLPGSATGNFDDKAFGFTVEADYLATDKLMLSARYDHMNAGGFVDQKADGKVVTLQARYYVRDNFALYLRDSYNIEGDDSSNALNNFQNLFAFGADFDF